jgi:hypothetical protein
MLVVWFGMSLGSSGWSSVAAGFGVPQALIVVAICHVGMTFVGRVALRMDRAAN